MVEAFSRSACILLQAALLIPPAVPRGFPTVPVAWGNPSPSLWNQRDLPLPEFSSDPGAQDVLF